ncbi:hypothetical protein SLS53_001359 [Cytospora paraplurivora]|uniref:Uncharacterized protein n=1 Tax=Cytospora paraplurivora TaxID=2898453 RepID=A0AAN9UJR1_9PEZI
MLRSHLLIRCYIRKSGAAVGIPRNALTALHLIGPSAAESLQRAGTVPQLGVRFKLGHGPIQGAFIHGADSTTEYRRSTSIVHRASFLRELMADIPRERMHASKKLVNVDRPTGEDIWSLSRFISRTGRPTNVTCLSELMVYTAQFEA